MAILFFDIETSGNKPQFDKLIECNPPKPDGRLKDPEKIAVNIEKKIDGMWERAALDADTGRVISIGWAVGACLDDIQVLIVGDEANNKASNAYTFVSSEYKILDMFWEVFRRCWGKCAGYNILGYDIPFLMRRSMALGLKLDFIPCLARYRVEPVTDLMMILYNWNNFKGLKTVAELYGLEVLAEDVDGSMAANLEPDQLALYQRSDVYLVQQLWSRMNGIYWPEKAG